MKNDHICLDLTYLRVQSRIKDLCSQPESHGFDTGCQRFKASCTGTGPPVGAVPKIISSPYDSSHYDFY